MHMHAHIHTQRQTYIALSVNLLPPVSMQSVISTRTASRALLTYSDLQSLMLSVTLWTHLSLTLQIMCKTFHSLSLPLSSNIPPCQSTPLSSHQFPTSLNQGSLSASNCCAEHPQSCYCNSLDENSFPRVESDQTEKSSWPPSHFLLSSTDCLTSFFFLFLQTNHMLYSAITRP